MCNVIIQRVKQFQPLQVWHIIKMDYRFAVVLGNSQLILKTASLQECNDGIQDCKQTRMVRVKRERSSPWRKTRTRQSDQTNPLSIYPNLLVLLCFVSTPNGNSLKPTQTNANLCEKVHRKAVSLHHQTHTSCTQRKVNFFSFYPSYDRFELVSVW